jgi:hypothetical protein
VWERSGFLTSHLKKERNALKKLTATSTVAVINYEVIALSEQTFDPQKKNDGLSAVIFL